MPDRWKTISVISVIVILVFLLAFIPTLVSASRQSDSPLPTPVAPEPYPNTDIYPAVVYLATFEDMQVLYRLNIDFEGGQPVDGIRNPPDSNFEPSIATVYIDPDQSDALSSAGLSLVPIPNEGYRSFLAYGPGTQSPPGWPTFEQYKARMQALESAHPGIVDLVQIGTSVQGRELLCLKITDNLVIDENEPEFKYTANHHGDETTGIEMTMLLAELLANSYGSDPVLTDMVDKMEIWLCPIYNPDGYVNGSRFNAHGVNLNRDFPDRFTDPIDDPAGHEPETQAFMQFGYAHRFVMGANYHGGAQVLNYPWDAIENPNVPDYAPDDQLFIDFGIGYTSRNPDLWYGGFENGITRGWEWYMIYGGMQDWAYFWRDEHHVTLEISNTKAPLFTQMPAYWNRNREAMLWWMQQAWTGLGGLVLDAIDSSPISATITLVGRDLPNTIHTDPEAGDYHRVISDGSYTLNVVADPYLSQTVDVTVISGTLTTMDFYLCRDEPWVVSGNITDTVTGFPLQATIEFIGSRQVTNSHPETGQYTIEICPASYTMRVSAPWHYPKERVVEINQDQIQNFSLDPTPNLSPSTKQASLNQVLPGDVLQYQLRIENLGPTTTVSVTDTLPISVTWTGDLTATQGTPIFDSGQIHWQGEVTPTLPVTITYGVTLNQCLPSTTTILNIAEFDDGVSGIITGKVLLEVLNSSPSIPTSPSPIDGSIHQPISTTLAWAPCTDLNCDPISYDLYFGASSPPELVAMDLTVPNFNPAPLLPGTTYYWYVIASDGIVYTAGSSWRFVTLPLTTYLPITLK